MKLKLNKNIAIKVMCGIGVILGTSGCINDKSPKVYEDAVDIPVNQTMRAELTAPPNVPTPVGRRKAKNLIVDMEILELEGELADGVRYMYWTFDGYVPGSFIRTVVGDEIEFHLKNHPQNKLPHNIDLHAVNGPGGGAVSSLTAPGHETVFSFKVLNPGLYVYHCATAPVGMHIANGMYGLILVEPNGGLEPVDKEFYIMQGDFYTEGDFGEPGLQPFDMKKAIEEDADYVVFNGHVGAMVGDKALEVNVGETVRLFVGNAGPNLISSFHVIGEIFDKVNVEGGTLVNENVQTTVIPAGGAAIIEFKVDAPGEYLLVDHSVFRAFNKGALAQIEAKGEKNKKVYKGKIEEGIYEPEGGAIQKMPIDEAEVAASKPPENLSKEQQMEMGKNVYGRTCVACHQSSGQGVPNAFPPLANSDYLNADVDRAIDIVLHGKSGEITVNGKKYNSVMTAQVLSDREVANVLTYVYNSWDNNGTVVTEEMVKKQRSKR
ncbi:copper-containing nitrite reductase [Marixanthomonas spongiae]|uniref:Copper-containing nitrite reductase n=1 Tax=Marixanthomonas spongiae TaxID=2174845 RepID=A0A2U0I3Y0_9FLAO|nr:copper-containing nitrite reductase [Marixanthomonas spongiae]PVW15817.1 nitrite reductase, copper-containing [Marixanthomonas spongiae]